MSTESYTGPAILGLALGAVGIAYDGMFPAGAIVGGAIGNVAGGVIRNISHEGLKGGYQAVDRSRRPSTDNFRETRIWGEQFKSRTERSPISPLTAFGPVGIDTS